MTDTEPTAETPKLGKFATTIAAMDPGLLTAFTTPGEDGRTVREVALECLAGNGIDTSNRREVAAYAAGVACLLQLAVDREDRVAIARLCGAFAAVYNAAPIAPRMPPVVAPIPGFVIEARSRTDGTRPTELAIARLNRASVVAMLEAEQIDLGDRRGLSLFGGGIMDAVTIAADPFTRAAGMTLLTTVAVIFDEAAGSAGA